MNTGCESVLIVRLRGGLGNQLFQYAAGRSLAARSNVPLLLDTKSSFVSDPYQRCYALKGFKLSNKVFEVDSTAFGFSAEVRRRFLHRCEILQITLTGRYFSPFIHQMHIAGPTVLDAYCQSPRYFRGMEDVLKEELDFKTVPTGVDPVIERGIRLTNSVCVHARRLLGVPADPSRAKPSEVSFYGAPAINYYQNALARLVRECGAVTAYLFSDSHSWARENSQLLAIPGCTVRVIEEQDALKSFYLMRLCKHFVLANSTFGWWAAWLGDFACKVVCIPSVWNRGEKRFPRELFPENWMIIPAA
jgi:hypothetical protein